MNNDLHLNKSLPYIIHIDLNSCFAIIEQQANRLLRGRPVGVSAYDTPRGFVLASSYEAKAKGVKLGVNVQQARALCPDIVILTPDPAKYREAHKRFKNLLLAYTPVVSPKSIDEFVLDMSNSPTLRERLARGMTHNDAMLDIGRSMKQDIRDKLGEWVTVNVGISTNRFLAKYAAGFDKPDGMMLIDHTNLRSKYENQKLVDLPGINTRYRARLRVAGIYSPLDFLAADMQLLKNQVFKSINGYHWYRRLRGYEADAVEFSRKSIGHQYALSDKTTDVAKLERLLLKLCEKTGRRLRKNNYYASGIHLYLGFVSDYPAFDGPSSFENMHTIRSWHHGEKVHYRLYSTSDIYEAAKRLLHQAANEEFDGTYAAQPAFRQRVKIMSVHVFDLQPWDPEQLTIFDIEKSQEHDGKGRVVTVAQDIRSAGARKRVSDAVDAINNRYGEFVLTPAVMMDMQKEILDRIAFGQVRDM